MAENNRFDYIVRSLQLLFAPIVIGTDAYGTHRELTLEALRVLTPIAIHVFRGHDDHVDSPVFDGDATLHVGVPVAWSFLMFCAVWTVLVVVWHFVEPGLESRLTIRYVSIVTEAVAVLSWLAGFIAVAVNVSTTDACSSGQSSCAELKVATAFGAFEWLLFMITAIPAVTSLFNNPKRVSSS